MRKTVTKIKRYIQNNIWLIVLGMALTYQVVNIAHEERGYFAIGGEWLILPVLLLLRDILSKTVEVIRFVQEKER